MRSAVDLGRTEFLDALVARGELITPSALFGLTAEQSIVRIKHVLHLVARQEHGDSITPDYRPKLASIDAFCPEFRDVLLCAAVSNPGLVKLLLEYGPDTEVTGY